MPTVAPALPLFPAQVALVATYLRENPEVARGHGLAPAEAGAPLPEDTTTRTYHLGTQPTPGRGYDDRLTMRTGFSRSTLLALLARWTTHGGKRGGLRHIQEGSKYVVTEMACAEYFGDKKQAA